MQTHMSNSWLGTEFGQGVLISVIAEEKAFCDFSYHWLI